MREFLEESGMFSHELGHINKNRDLCLLLARRILKVGISVELLKILTQKDICGCISTTRKVKDTNFPWQVRHFRRKILKALLKVGCSRGLPAGPKGLCNRKSLEVQDNGQDMTEGF